MQRQESLEPNKELMLGKLRIEKGALREQSWAYKNSKKQILSDNCGEIMTQEVKIKKDWTSYSIS